MFRVLNLRLGTSLPAYVYVGRPSIWGNPTKVDEILERNPMMSLVEAHQEAVDRYREYLKYHPVLVGEIKRELRGKNLACWCAPLPCHADVLLEIANE